MKTAEQHIAQELEVILNSLFPGTDWSTQLTLQQTKKEFEGDITFVTFQVAKLAKLSPEVAGEKIGEALLNTSSIVSKFNVVKGFLNLSISDSFWTSTLPAMLEVDFGKKKADSEKTYLVEYSSPNTNKPLHLGHLRNNFLGYSVSQILKANGNRVKMVQVINDRGIHICKSMLAWKKSGKNETPENTGLKGDKLVGKYYVEFDRALREELKPIMQKITAGENTGLFSAAEQEKLNVLVGKLGPLQALLSEEQKKIDPTVFALIDKDFEAIAQEIKSNAGPAKNLIKAFEKIEKPDAQQKELLKQIRNIHGIEVKIDELKAEIKEMAQNKTALMKEAQQMLQLWEQQDPDTIALWKTMNGWVYEGFNQTYKTIGVSFDKLYYESETYLLGKDQVLEGLEKGVFFKKEDGSVWCDLTADGLDEKLVLRGDGTSVYITQDIGTALLRLKDFPDMNGMIYTVGNEQDYHFKVLFLILKKLGHAFANECFHLSYGMVDLPSGKMKSREGTVVDADDLAAEMMTEAKNKTMELGKIQDIDPSQQDLLFHTLGMGALKYYILKVDPKKRMLFNPSESIDFQGNTGPFLQYTYARIQSLLKKSGISQFEFSSISTLLPEEKEVVLQLNQYPKIIDEAAKQFSPALVANYLYELVKTYNHFYQAIPVLKETDEPKKALRLALSAATGNVVKSGLDLLGIQVPEKM